MDCATWADLQVDHVDPALKVTHKVWSWAQARREVELAKCVVRCRPCHQERTAEQFRKEIVHGRHVTYTYRKCRCDECTAAHAEYKRVYDAARRLRSQPPMLDANGR